MEWNTFKKYLEGGTLPMTKICAAYKCKNVISNGYFCDQCYTDIITGEIRNRIYPEDIYSLDITIVEFLLPRLKEFKKTTKFSYPAHLTPEEWSTIIDKFILFFEKYLKNYTFMSIEKDESITEFCTLFRKYFSHLWY